MPRSATTIFGLVLVALSIGFNTWRYPIVWRLAGSSAAPAAAAESPRGLTATPAAEPAKPAPVNPAPTLATQNAAQPAAAETNKPAAIPTSPVEVSPPISAAPVAAEKRLPVAVSQEKPLVPVPKMVAFAKPSGSAEGTAGVRRLPPVDTNSPSPATLYASGSSDGAIPIYPSTGM